MVQFPNTYAIEIPAIGISGNLTNVPSTGPKDDYTYTNLGGAGIVVSYKHGDETRNWWGSRRSIEKVKFSCACE
jgi:hypothetical protein